MGLSCVFWVLVVGCTQAMVGRMVGVGGKKGQDGESAQNMRGKK